MSLSPLESLSNEILHDIFLRTLNLNLPQASPCIASKLSTEYCYFMVCFAYLNTSDTDRSQQSAQQSRIFAYKWMTWNFFQRFVTKAYEDTGCICGNTNGCHDPIWPPNFVDPTAMTFSRSHFTPLTYLKCRLPVKLLGGPWTSEKIEFLRFLLWTTSMTVDWADKDVRKIALQGKKDAILEGNGEAVDLFNQNRRLGKAPTMEMIRMAVEEGCDRTIIFNLMQTAQTWGRRDKGWEDESLDEWVKTAIASGNPKGEWLRLKLKELRQYHGYIRVSTGDYDAEGDVLDVVPRRWTRVSDPKYHPDALRRM